MEFVKVADRSELSPGMLKLVVVDGQEILLTYVDGDYHAIANRCPHAYGSLASGSLNGAIIKCPRHGALFDVRTGANVGPAKLGFLKLPVRDQACYPVKVEGKDLFVGIERIGTPVG